MRIRNEHWVLLYWWLVVFSAFIWTLSQLGPQLRQLRRVSALYVFLLGRAAKAYYQGGGKEPKRKPKCACLCSYHICCSPGGQSEPQDQVCGQWRKVLPRVCVEYWGREHGLCWMRQVSRVLQRMASATRKGAGKRQWSDAKRNHAVFQQGSPNQIIWLFFIVSQNYIFHHLQQTYTGFDRSFH